MATILTGDMQWLRLPSAISKATKEGTFTVQQDFRFGRAVSIFHPAKSLISGDVGRWRRKKL
jgi:hypothetical protein